MDMDNLLGMMDLRIEANICTDASMVMALLLLGPKSTTKVNGLMASKMVKAFFLINRVL